MAKKNVAEAAEPVDCPTCNNQTVQPFCDRCGTRLAGNKYLGQGQYALQARAQVLAGDAARLEEQSEVAKRSFEDAMAPLLTRAEEVATDQAQLDEALAFARANGIE